MLSGVVLWTSSAFAGHSVILAPGQTYRAGGDTVICTDGGTVKPLAVTECQYWDDFNKKCLYKSTRYVLSGMECVEECQHWDRFFKRCDYAVSCTYHPAQGVFLKKSCADFDTFHKKCLRERQQIIGRGYPENDRHRSGARSTPRK